MKKTVPMLTALLALCLTACGRAPANTVFSLTDLPGKTVACQFGTTGYSYAGNIADITVEGYDKGADAIKALKTGWADAVIIDSEPAAVFVAQNSDLMILNDPFVVEEYAIAYSKDNAELGEQLNEALESLKADGTLEEITSHWIGDDADHVSYVPDVSVSRNGTLVMATHTDFPPYESKEDERIVGIDIDMMQAVCDRLGKELVVEDMGFKEIFTAVASHKADVGAAGMTVTDERKEKVAFTQSYATSKQVIIVRRD
ncbi:MAG: transporter substrate-binding domain-containing protein [Oscillospiraceae bacterium]|nr:transporter substrate-binding domain-containing protein [Oscillospiraceae bacterium]